MSTFGVCVVILVWALIATFIFEFLKKKELMGARGGVGTFGTFGVSLLLGALIVFVVFALSSFVIDAITNTQPHVYLMK